MRSIRHSEASAREIALAWKASGISQEEFAARHGITGRTLRNYVRNHVRPVDVRTVNKVIDTAIAELIALKQRVTQEPSEDEPADQIEATGVHVEHTPSGLGGIPKPRFFFPNG